MMLAGMRISKGIGDPRQSHWGWIGDIKNKQLHCFNPQNTIISVIDGLAFFYTHSNAV